MEVVNPTGTYRIRINGSFVAMPNGELVRFNPNTHNAHIVIEPNPSDPKEKGKPTWPRKS